MGQIQFYVEFKSKLCTEEFQLQAKVVIFMLNTKKLRKRNFAQ